MRTTYTGSCHCGAVRFEVDVDLEQPTYRCNCSICSRTRFWPAIVKPEDIRMLAGSDELTEYRFNSMNNSHHFCRRCGVRPFGIGAMPDGSSIYGVNIGCLENVSPDVLAAAPIVYVDGAHDRFEPPLITAYL
jgi:hypothetical protein